MKVTWAAARNNAGLTQKEVCKAVGVGQNTIVEWEKYRKYPNVMQAQKLCEVYGCSMEDIFLEKA